MKWHLGLLGGLLAGCVLATAAMAGEGKDGAGEKPAKVKPPAEMKKHAPAQPLEPMTLTGRLGKGERTKKDKEGKEVTVGFLTLTLDDGTVVHLPQGKVKNADGTVTQLDPWIGKQVTVTGRGRTFEKKGKKGTLLAKIESAALAAE